jgi:Sulfotransferase family
MHIGKTGGSAVKTALRRAGLAYWHDYEAEDMPMTPYGRIRLEHHTFLLRDLPPDDYVFFCVRDPVSRFVSAFYSRLTKGQPRFYREWSDGERRAFDAFPTAQSLAAALYSRDRDERLEAHAAMRSIQHAGSSARYLGTPWQLRGHLSQVAYIARQETLDRDWEELKSLLGLPPRTKLPTGRRAHKRDPSLDTRLDAAATEALRKWYARDYQLLRYCERVRTWRGWGGEAAPPEGIGRVRHEARRLRTYPALLFPAPAVLHQERRHR